MDETREYTYSVCYERHRKERKARRLPSVHANSRACIRIACSTPRMRAASLTINKGRIPMSSPCSVLFSLPASESRRPRSRGHNAYRVN